MTRQTTRGQMAKSLRVQLEGLKANFGAGPIFGCETAEEVYKRYLPAKTETPKFPLAQPNPIFVDHCHFGGCDERGTSLFEGHMYCRDCLHDKLRFRAKLQERERQDRMVKHAIALISMLNITGK
jgi:hypothetical protein